MKILAGIALGVVAGGALGVAVAWGLGAYSRWQSPADPSSFSVAIVVIFTLPIGCFVGGLIGGVVGAIFEGRE